MPQYIYKFTRKALNLTIDLKKSMRKCNDSGLVQLMEIMTETTIPSRNEDFFRGLDQLTIVLYNILNNPKRFK